MSNEKSNFGFWIFVAILIGIYLLYKLAVWASVAFVIWGFNSFFFLDNLFSINSFNPVVMWGIFGLLIGSIVGVIVVAKKLNLSKSLILYPFSFVILLITIMCFVNKPVQHYGSYTPVNVLDSYIQKTYYTLNNNGNVRSGPSVNNSKLFSLIKGNEVEVIQKGFYDSENAEWFKINYNYKEGYMNSKLLDYSRTVNENKTNSK